MRQLSDAGRFTRPGARSARRRITTLAVAVCGAVASLAAAGAVSAGAAAARSPAAPAAAAAPSLTLPQLAGQRVIYSYTGLTPPSSLISLIEHGEAAGVIFFSDNITSQAQIAAVIRTLEAADANPDNPVRAPLLLMTDQEGGEVRRLPGPPYLSEKQIGESADPASAASTAGVRGGNNLRSVGMNVNLAPVLDVYRAAGDFDDQYQRSYSMNPDVVSELGADFISAQQQTGVAATGKHFPGLGAATASQNTDEVPVTLNLSAATIRGVDEYPYRAAIAAGVKLVMMDWAVYPALGSKRPAGLSGLDIAELRNRLGFKGVTITDALEAGALKAFGSYQNRAWLAAGAGMDLILCSDGNPAEGQDAMSGMEAGWSNGTLNQAGFRAAVARIDALRASLPG
jgi:beta-N-acetylhexosaminidase